VPFLDVRSNIHLVCDTLFHILGMVFAYVVVFDYHVYFSPLDPLQVLQGSFDILSQV
jgi:hypothetical protein